MDDKKVTVQVKVSEVRQILELTNALVPVMRKNELLKLMSVYSEVLARITKEAGEKE